MQAGERETNDGPLEVHQVHNDPKIWGTEQQADFGGVTSSGNLLIAN
jgi:hypothetical protein